MRLSAGIDSISLLAFKNNQVHGSLVEALRVAKNSIHVGLHGVAKTIPFEASKYAHFPVFDLSLVRTRRSSSADGLHVVAVEMLDVVKAERVHYEGSYALLYPMLSYPNTTHLCLDRVTAPDFGLRLGVFPNLQHLELSNAQISYKCKAQGVVDDMEAYNFGLGGEMDHYRMNNNFYVEGFQELEILVLIRCCVYVSNLPKLREFHVFGGMNLMVLSLNLCKFVFFFFQ